MDVIPLGPLALSVGALMLLAGVLTALAINGWLRRRGRPSVEGLLWWLLLAGIVVARAVFVLHWWPQYAAQPLAILDLRDGGFSAWAGMLAVLAGALFVGWQRPKLRGSLVAAVLGGVLAWSFGSLATLRLTTTTHPPLPALVLQDLDQRSTRLQDLRGQPLVVNLWASWCGPCRQEMPMFAEAQRSRPGVRFIFANQGEGRAKIRSFLADTGLHLDGVLVDPFSKLSRDFNVRGYPTTLFFDARGNLVTIHTGLLSRATLAVNLRHTVPVPAAAEPSLSRASP